MDEFEKLFIEMARNMLIHATRKFEKGISMSQFFFLDSLEEEPKTVGDISAQLGISMSAVTGLADKLEQSGCLTRSRNPIDRRIVDLSITEKGKEKAKEAKEKYQKFINRIHGELTETELKNMKKIYEKIVKHYKEEGI